VTPALDTYRRRMKAFENLPRLLSANTVMSMTDADLDRLASASADEYSKVLTNIIRRINDERRADAS